MILKMPTRHEPMEITARRRQARRARRERGREDSQREAQCPPHDNWCPDGLHWPYGRGLFLAESTSPTTTSGTSANFPRASANQFSRIARRRREDKFRCRPMNLNFSRVSCPACASCVLRALRRRGSSPNPLCRRDKSLNAPRPVRNPPLNNRNLPTVDWPSLRYARTVKTNVNFGRQGYV